MYQRLRFSLRMVLPLLIVMAAGCATLPDLPPRSAELAVQNVTSSPLARLAAASAPSERPDWSGFRLFYSGESVLLPEYRGRGLGRRFFQEREAHVRALGRFETVCFCAVQRPAHHPRRPVDYQPLDALWTRQGFVKHPELCATFSWRDLDEAAESPKPMVFWLKSLR